MALLFAVTLAMPAASTDASTSSVAVVPETVFQQVADPGVVVDNKVYP